MTQTCSSKLFLNCCLSVSFTKNQFIKDLLKCRVEDHETPSGSLRHVNPFTLSVLLTAYNTRTVPKKTPADDEDEDEDFGDDDSFINDDSEDAGDDSDYAPPDSDDSGKEDIKRLQKEAKAFLKKRK